jgi:hypothetical protein
MGHGRRLPRKKIAGAFSAGGLELKMEDFTQDMHDGKTAFDAVRESGKVELVVPDPDDALDNKRSKAEETHAVNVDLSQQGALEHHDEAIEVVKPPVATVCGHESAENLLGTAPSFFQSSFVVRSSQLGQDTFLYFHAEGEEGPYNVKRGGLKPGAATPCWTKGAVWLNGFNLGRCVCAPKCASVWVGPHAVLARARNLPGRCLQVKPWPPSRLNCCCGCVCCAPSVPRAQVLARPRPTELAVRAGGAPEGGRQRAAHLGAAPPGLHGEGIGIVRNRRQGQVHRHGQFQRQAGMGVVVILDR